jgi:uncharacterized membrane protein YkoI
MKTGRMLMISFLLFGLVTVSIARAQEKKITRAELPPAVEKTVAEQSKTGTVRGFSTEVEDGKRLYEVELTVEGHGKDISMDLHGNVVEVEEEISMDALPPEARKGLTEAARGGTILKIESITKNGKLVAYEADMKTAAKQSEIQVSPNGKRLTHPK